MTGARPTGTSSTPEWPRAGARREGSPFGIDRWIGRDLRHLLVSQAAPLVASALVTFVTASILGPGERGRLAFVIATASLVGILGCFSLHIGAVNAVRRGRRSAPIQLLVLLIIGLFLLNLAVLGVRLSVGSFTLGLFTSTSLLEIVSTASLFALNLFVTRTRQGLGDNHTFQHASILQALLYLIGAISLAAVTHRASPVVVTWDIALAAATLYCLPGLIHIGRGTAKGSVLAALTESGAAHVGIVGQQALYRADTVLLGIWAPARQVGLYSVATPVAETVWVVSEALSLRTFARAEPSDPSAAFNAYFRAVRLNWQLCMAGGFLLAAASWLLLPELLPEYRSSVHLIWLLSPGMVFQGYARIGLSALLGSGRRRAAVWVGAFSALSVAVYIPLILALDATGAAIGSSCAYLMQALAVRWLIRQELGQVHPQAARHRRAT